MPRLRRLISLFVLLLGCYSVVAQPKASLQDSSINITGSVQSQGKPISGALITLWNQQGGDDPTEWNTVATGRTDSGGNYELKNVPTGNYYIGVSAPGFVTGKENNWIEKLRFVTVVGGKNLGPFDFELVREGVISGVVTDWAGKPIAGIPITLIVEVVPGGGLPPRYAQNIRTDDQGRYRVAGMPPGKYRIAAGHWPLLQGTSAGKPAYPRVFYPSAREQTGARVFDISPGAEVADINFNLDQPTKTFTVRARIIDEGTGKPIEGLDCSLRGYLDGKEMGGRGFANSGSNARGEIVITDIPPGEYSIRAPEGFFSKGGPQMPNYSGESRHFEVVDKDVAEVEVRVTKAASVAGFVVVEGTARADVLARVPEVILTGVVETNPVTPSPILHATIHPDGSFLFTGLRPGKLRIYFPSPGRPLPLYFIRSERDGVKLDGNLEVQLGDEITGLRLVMAYAASGVHGFLKLDDGSVPRGLIGMASVQGNVLGNRSVVNQNGEFILQNLMAGEYKLVVNAHDAIDRHWTVEQKIKIVDDQVSDATMVLDSKVKPNPAATEKSYLKP